MEINERLCVETPVDSADDVLPAGASAKVEAEAVRTRPRSLRTLTSAVKRLALKVTHRIGGRSRRQEVVDLPLAELRPSER